MILKYHCFTPHGFKHWAYFLKKKIEWNWDENIILLLWSNIITLNGSIKVLFVGVIKGNIQCTFFSL